MDKSTPSTSVSSSSVSNSNPGLKPQGDSLMPHNRWTLRIQDQICPMGTLSIFSERNGKCFEPRFSSSHFPRLKEMVVEARAQLWTACVCAVYCTSADLSFSYTHISERQTSGRKSKVVGSVRPQWEKPRKKFILLYNSNCGSFFLFHHAKQYFKLNCCHKWPK